MTTHTVVCSPFLQYGVFLLVLLLMEITAGSLAAAYRNEVLCLVVPRYMISGGTVLLVTVE